MGNTRCLRVIATLLPVLASMACGEGGNGSSAVERSVQAVGGRAALEAVQTQVITSSGTWFEPEQTFRPDDDPRSVSDFDSTLTQDFASDRFRYDWTRDIRYPFTATQVYSEVVDANQGVLEGQDGSGPTPAAMPSVRVATIRKLNRLTSPLVLLRAALTDPAGVETRADEVFESKTYQVIAFTRESPSPIRLFLDPVTGLPAKADTVEDDPYYGDTLHEVLFSDWRQIGALQVPFRLTQRLKGLGRTMTIQDELRSDVHNDVQVPAETLAIPAQLQVPPAPADATRGARMAQWFLRRQAIGLPGFVDQSSPVVFTETRPGSGVHHVTGGTHHSLVVELADHLIVAEPPLYESRSQAVIAEIKARFPGKPIRYVVVSHFHNDHGGGVRAYAAEGATVVAGEASREHFEAILAAPHALVPDALQTTPRPAEVLAVPEAGGLALSGGAVAVYSVTGQTHAADLVVTFVPAEGVLFVSDLLSPGAPTIAAGDIPQPLRDTFARFNLTVTAIAGGHGTLAAVQ